jgi:hypothetical protein
MFWHTLTISLQVAAVAAFVILWYFWIRRKLTSHMLLDEEERVLVPFRHFCWIFIGLVVLTSVAQVHFIRVSSTVHERLAAMAALQERQQKQASALDELKVMVQKMRTDMDSNFRGLRAQMPDRVGQIQGVPQAPVAQAGPETVTDKHPLLAMDAPKSQNPARSGFAGAARSAGGRKVPLPPQGPKAGEPEDDQTYSMKLARQGRVLKDRLRVRQRPDADAPIMDRLMSGQEVKVTEKHQHNEAVWFKVITPTGRSGWVDYRYVKLDGNG